MFKFTKTKNSTEFFQKKKQHGDKISYSKFPAVADVVGKPVIKTFQTHVANHTLEMQFYWAGRGTRSIPYRGSFGPLISAISLYQ